MYITRTFRCIEREDVQRKAYCAGKKERKKEEEKYRRKSKDRNQEQKNSKVSEKKMYIQQKK